MKLAPISARWLAGCIDCDGCVGLSLVLASKGLEIRPRMSFHNRHEGLLQEVMRTIRALGGTCTLHWGASSSASVMVSCGTVCSVLQEIEPYLIVKQERAQLILQYRTRKRGSPYTSRDFTYWLRSRELNATVARPVVIHPHQVEEIIAYLQWQQDPKVSELLGLLKKYLQGGA